MTDRRDDNPMPRDPRFDAAWASVSNEVPPPALDAAIRAAARREVGARPRDAAAAVPEATRPERWWFPLAAAATIGAVALGLLQIVGRDDVFDDGGPTVVSDMPPGPTEARRDTTMQESAAGKTTAPKSVAASESLPAGVAIGAAPVPAPEVSVPAAAPPLRFGPAPSPLPAAAADAAVPSAPAIGAPAALTSRERPAGVGASNRLAATPAERPRADAARETRQAGTPLPVPEWIALIRRLRDEGRTDAAVKELAAFRREHADHLQLLPPDLAHWRPEAR